MILVKRYTPRELIARWREHGIEIDPYNPGAARAYLNCADQLERSLRQAGDEPLSIENAALESGYSAEHLRRLVREGTIPNAGSPYRPRIRRRDLPRKPASVSQIDGLDRTG